MTWPTAEPEPAPRLWSAIRLDAAGRVDDIAIDRDLFRLERMSDDTWWLAVCRGWQETSFWISRQGKQVVVTVTDDGIGCVDDSRPAPAASLRDRRPV